MVKKNNVPKIRFKGFTEEWEQHEVGDFLIESRVRGNTGVDAKKLTVKLWGKGVVEKNDFGGSEHTQYFTRRKGQFIYSKLDFLNSAFGVIPEKLDNYESTADLPAFDSDGMNPYFMFFIAIQKSFYLKHGSIADGSRKAKRIHADTFLNMPISVPTIDEQNLIVEYLQCVDNLITLHQHKYDKYKNTKNALLEKMFPKNGAKIPEIRFKGFADDWEQRELKEILTQRIEHQTITKEAPLLSFSYEEGVIEPENKKTNKRDFIMIDKYRKVFSRTEVNDIIYNPANIIHGAIHRNKLRTGVVSPIYKIFKCNNYVSPKYIGERLHTNKFIKEIVKYIEGTVIKLRTLAPEKFMEMEIEIPKNIIEQDLIGIYFQHLDNLITLHQRMVEKLKNIKKALLEKMFI